MAEHISTKHLKEEGCKWWIWGDEKVVINTMSLDLTYHLLVPNGRVRTALQPQLVYKHLHPLPLLLQRHASRKAQARGEHERLPHGQHGEQLVVLHHVAGQALEALLDGLAVHEDLALQADVYRSGDGV